MFEQALAVEYGRTNRAWTTVVGMAGQALAVAAAVVLPMMGPHALPPPQDLVRIFLPEPPVAPPPPAPQPAARSTPAPRTDLQLRNNVLQLPTRVPAKVMLIEEPPLSGAELGGATGGVPGGIPGGMPGGIPGGLPAAVAQFVPPPTPPAARERPAAAVAPAPKPEPVPVGGQVQEARLIRRIIPDYPPLAMQARISGTVELIGVVGTDGRIQQLKVVSGHPFLVESALRAVRQWVYRPTYLNGNPVEVIAPITVRFKLN